MCLLTAPAFARPGDGNTSPGMDRFGQETGYWTTSDETSSVQVESAENSDRHGSPFPGSHSNHADWNSIPIVTKRSDTGHTYNPPAKVYGWSWPATYYYPRATYYVGTRMPMEGTIAPNEYSVIVTNNDPVFDLVIPAGSIIESSFSTIGNIPYGARIAPYASQQFPVNRVPVNGLLTVMYGTETIVSSVV